MISPATQMRICVSFKASFYKISQRLSPFDFEYRSHFTCGIAFKHVGIPQSGSMANMRNVSRGDELILHCGTHPCSFLPFLDLDCPLGTL